MNVVSLCSGVGLLDLGLEWAGMRTVQVCEIDPWCRGLLGQRFPDAHVHDDVWTIDPVACDVVAAGIPCQPASVAGHREGLNDERWLWPAIERAIRIARPRYVVLENVPGLVTVSSEVEVYGNECVCGWVDRRRGMRLHHEGERTQLRGSDRHGHDGLGDGCASPDAPGIRWPPSNAPSGDRQVGGSSHACDHGTGGGGVLTGCAAVPSGEAGAGRDRAATRGAAPVSDPSWRSAGDVDGRSARSRGGDVLARSGAEPEGSIAGARDGGRDCPACGRRMDRAAVELVRRSGLGEVLGSLASVGFDAEWTCFRASDVGALHRRDRFWLVATSDPRQSGLWDERGGFFRPGWAGEAVAWAHGPTRPVADATREREREPSDETIPVADRRDAWQVPRGGGRRGPQPGLGGDPDWMPGWVDGPGRDVPLPARWLDGTWEDDVNRTTTETRNRARRLSALGNGVVPQCVELIGYRIRQLDARGAA